MCVQSVQLAIDCDELVLMTSKGESSSATWPTQQPLLTARLQLVSLEDCWSDGNLYHTVRGGKVREISELSYDAMSSGVSSFGSRV